MRLRNTYISLASIGKIECRLECTYVESDTTSDIVSQVDCPHPQHTPRVLTPNDYVLPEDHGLQEMLGYSFDEKRPILSG